MVSGWGERLESPTPRKLLLAAAEDENENGGDVKAQLRRKMNLRFLRKRHCLRWDHVSSRDYTNPSTYARIYLFHLLDSCNA